MKKLLALATLTVIVTNAWGMDNNFIIDKQSQTSPNVTHTVIGTIENVVRYGNLKNRQIFFKPILELLLQTKSENSIKNSAGSNNGSDSLDGKSVYDSEQRAQKDAKERLSAILEIRSFDSARLFLETCICEEADAYLDGLSFIYGNKEDDEHWTPLFYACSYGREELTKYFLKHGGRVHKKDDDGKTPLFYACESGNLNVVKACVENGANVNETNKNGSTPLFAACYLGYNNIIQYLVEHGADINKLNSRSISPLILAYQKDHKDTAKYLIELGADVSWALCWAYREGDKDMMEYFVDVQSHIVGKENIS
ncbi:MAG: ankyrin repeat domain-containing protein [Alphaproteobacteria bacterium]|nr:ankyrin repeat domain-containing protein [Alphaproteobacteria bacterium]